MYSFALIYIHGCKCRDGVKCLWECELMTGPLPWVLLTHNTDNTENNWILARKYKTLQNVNILEARFHSTGTSFFLEIQINVTRWMFNLGIQNNVCMRNLSPFQFWMIMHMHEIYLVSFCWYQPALTGTPAETPVLSIATGTRGIVWTASVTAQGTSSREASPIYV